MGLADDKTMTAGSNALLKRLLARGWEFDFFQAVWLLERYGGGRVPVGHRGPVGDESFRFRPDVSLGFPPTDVRRITHCTDTAGNASYYQVEVTFMGLYGVSTPLPLHYATDILRSVAQFSAAPTNVVEPESLDSHRADDPSAQSTPVRDFMDIFHHRLVSLFYRSWLKYRYDKTFGMPDRDTITDYLLWLIGCPRKHNGTAPGIPPIRMLRYAGILTQRPRSATTLEGMLEDFWEDLPIEAQQCVGRWVPVSPADQNSIGVANSRLGSDLTVGEQVYDLSGAFNLTVGPMDWTTYLLFLPGEQRFTEMRALVGRYCADPLSTAVELRLHPGEIPELRLVSDDDGSRLGFTSWVRTGEIPETAVTFDLSPAAPLQVGPASVPDNPPAGRDAGSTVEAAAV